jgi:phosphoglycolate phosphatase
LLDLDGTLVDSIPDLAWSVNQTLLGLSLPERDILSIRNWVGNGLEKLLHRSLTNDFDGKADDALFEQAMSIFMSVYSENMCNLSTCYPGVLDGIAQLKEKQITLGCVTNKRGEFVGPILEKLGLMNDMSIVIAGDTLAKKKPDPLPLLHAATHFNKDPALSLMVGDSESDVKAARAAGFQIICVSYGYNHGRDIYETNPDAVIDSIADLVRLFT